jgi:hypothetical protein
MKAGAAALAVPLLSPRASRVLYAWFEGGWEPRFWLGGRMQEHRDLVQIAPMQVGTLAHDGCAWTRHALKVAVGLDTHFDSDLVHEARQRAGWDLLADIVSERRMKGELGTLVAFSELERSPVLNAFGGRDHALATRIVVIGSPAGVSTGHRVGA